VHEGKNEICARIGYFNYGINLKTETPNAGQIKKAVHDVLANKKYANNVNRLAQEFSQYEVTERFEHFLALAMGETHKWTPNLLQPVFS
jgi:UDP:flavonoid glycosyltransferase YjiC (YdhE family)